MRSDLQSLHVPPEQTNNTAPNTRANSAWSEKLEMIDGGEQGEDEEWKHRKEGHAGTLSGASVADFIG